MSGGFERPILHGLCSFGFTGRVLWQNAFHNDAMRLHEMGARFTSHVFPGETLVVSGWQMPDHLYFETSVKERGTVCLKGYAKVLHKSRKTKCSF